MLQDVFEPVKPKSLNKAERPVKARELLALALKTCAVGADVDDLLIIIDNAIKLDTKCWEAHAERAGLLRTSTDRHEEAHESAVKATRVKKVLVLPRSDKDGDIAKAIEGTVKALKKDNASLFGLYNQLVLEQAILLKNIKPEKKDTEAKEARVKNAFKLAMAKILEADPLTLLDHEAQAYATAKVEGVEVVYDKLLDITKIPEYRDSIRIYVAAAQFAEDDAQKEYCYNEALRCEPQYAQGHYELGVIQYNKGQYAVAEAMFKKAVDLDADFTDAVQYYAASLVAQDKYDSMISFFEKYANTHADYAEGYHVIAVAYKQKKNYTKALEAIDKALKLEENDILYLCKKAAFLTDQGQDVTRDREALALVNKAYDIYKQKQADESLEQLNEQNQGFINWAFNSQRQMLLEDLNRFQEAKVTADVSEETKAVLEAQKEDMLQKVLVGFNKEGSDVDQMKAMMGFMQEMFAQVKQLKHQLNEATEISRLKESIQQDADLFGYYKAVMTTLETQFVEARLITKQGAKLAIDSSNWLVGALSGMASVLPGGSIIGAGLEAAHEGFKEAKIKKAATKFASMSPTIGDFDDDVSLCVLRTIVKSKAELKSHISAQAEPVKGMFGKMKAYCMKKYNEFKGQLWEEDAAKVGAADALGIIHSVMHGAGKFDMKCLLPIVEDYVTNHEGCSSNEVASLGEVFDQMIALPNMP